MATAAPAAEWGQGRSLIGQKLREEKRAGARACRGAAQHRPPSTADSAGRGPEQSAGVQSKPKQSEGSSVGAMPRSASWLGATGLDRMDGAGSCHSVARTTCDDGLEHLSAEEKACLLFLEETIESLDNEGDKLKDSQKRGGCSSSTPKPGVTSDNVLRAQPLSADHKHKNPAPPPAQLEDNVLTPPPTKPRDGLLKAAEGPPPRGPLSYDALVHLRKSTSTKKTPLCPTVDHTIDSGKEPSLPVGGPKLGSVRPRSQAAVAKRPPPVAPKPKSNLAKPSVKAESEGPTSSDSLYQLGNVTNPEVVRLEALQKLGLLKETQAERDTLGPLPPPKSHSFLHPKPSRVARGPSRSPSFGSSRVRAASEDKPLPSGAGSQRLSGCEQQAVAAGWPERSATKQTHTNGGSLLHSGSAKAPPRPQNSSNTVGYTVVVVPGVGADRKEALRKLGLLKN